MQLITNLPLPVLEKPVLSMSTNSKILHANYVLTGKFYYLWAAQPAEMTAASILSSVSRSFELFQNVGLFRHCKVFFCMFVFYESSCLKMQFLNFPLLLIVGVWGMGYGTNYEK